MSFAARHAGKNIEGNGFSAFQMGFCGFAQHGAKRRLPQVKVVFPRAAHRPQNVAAPVRLGADQLGIFAQIWSVCQFLGKLCACQLDGRKRRSQFVRRRCNHAAKVCQLLFTGQSHLSRKQCIRHASDFCRDAPGIQRQEHDPDHDGQPEPVFENRGHLQNRPVSKAQRQVVDPDNGNKGNGNEAKQDCCAQLQRAGRDRNRYKDQQGEGVVQTPGQGQQDSQLRYIEKQRKHRARF